tara:strand:+ start:786 stop:1538 length:753 start_codon:yes stop_codon:yes gene_type:complete
MKAIILAAGKGERLQPFTKEIPKSLLKIGDQTILENQINHLKACDIDEVNVVVGFAYERVEEFLSNLQILGMKINTIYNPFWNTTNSLFSLWSARSVLNSDTVLLNGDDVFELKVLRKILSTKEEICVPYKVKDSYAAEDMKVNIENGLVVSIGKDLKNISGESVGVRVFRNEGVDILKRSLEKEIRTEKFNKKWYASAISRILKRGHKISSIDIGDLYWHDVDYPNDLNNAKLNIDRISSNNKTNLRVV